MFDRTTPKKALVIAGNRQILYHAVSALEYFNQSFESTTLVISGSGIYRQQTLEAALQFPWAEVFSVDENEAFRETFRFLPKSWACRPTFHFVKAVLVVRRCNEFIHKRFLDSSPIDLLVSGFYGYPIDRTACTTVKHKLFILVDDGNMTREVANNRQHEAATLFKRTLENNSTFQWDGFKGWIKLYSYRLFGHVKDYGSKSICFFTHYPDIVGYQNDTIILIRQKFPLKKILDNVVHFLGLPAIERNIVKAEDFCELLRWIGERYKGKTLHYFSHPGDTNKERKLVKQILPDSIWHRNIDPYEQRFKLFDEIPGLVAGFYSSALFNLASYDNENFKIESLEIPISMIDCPTLRKRVEDIYNRAKQYPRINWVTFRSTTS